ncbi:glycosyl hydrolase 53 family protein [Paenibacillus sp. FA6]|uniref:glycosyl hydrolase 53 family protein n=1 Tax=Paenibacillus sp. FA6 TaxID=3413029 RepID=UPI003F656D00
MRDASRRVSLLLVIVLLLSQFVIQPRVEAAEAKTNVALGAFITASDEDTQWGGLKENAVDGDIYSKWSVTNSDDGHWLMVDFGQSYDLSGTDIEWKDDVLVKYHIETSPDNTTWTTWVDQTANSTQNMKVSHTASANQARYVRVTIDSYSGTGYWAGINEWKIWKEARLKDPTDIISYDAVNILTLIGAEPTLPSEITAHYNDGTDGVVHVIWETISLDQIISAGTFLVAGTVTGASIQPSAQVTVDAFDDEMIRGVDISTLTAIEDNGGKYYDGNGAERDLLDILKDRGVNYVRVRLWNNPTKTNYYQDQYYSNKEDVIRLSKRVKEKGMKLLLDFHYSDEWAHPGQQIRPVAWADYTQDQLNQAVHDYTYEIISELQAEGAMPDMVQIGNEINSGLLNGLKSTPNFDENARLLKSGVAGVRQVPGGDQIQIMIHLAEGGKYDLFHWYFSELKSRNVDYDVIGLSYYPFWHGTYADVQNTMDRISAEFDKDVVIAETSYPFSYKNGDAHENVLNDDSKLIGGATFPATVQGQYDAMKAVMDALRHVPNGKGAGFFYWEPAWIPANVGWIDEEGDAWENQSMFDYDEYPANGGYGYKGYALDSLDVFKLGLAAIPTDRMELAAVIGNAKGLIATDFTPDSWATLQPSIITAEQVYSKAYGVNGVTQSEVDSAADILQAVIDQLEVIAADKTQLIAVIAEAEQLNPNDWTAVTWAVVEKALVAARAMNDNSRATQTDVNLAIGALQTAIQGVSNVDKSRLAEFISTVKTYKSSGYTATSWSKLIAALAEASVVNENPNAIQSQVDKALAELQSAVNRLVLLTELSLGKTTSASSNAGNGGGKSNAPEGAIDHNTTTSWGTDQGHMSWWKLDMGVPVYLKKIEMLLWGGGIKYTIAISDDDVNYSTIIDTTSDVITTTTPAHNLSDYTEARYIKVTITDGPTDWVGISEFAAYGVYMADKTKLATMVATVQMMDYTPYTQLSWSRVEATLTAAMSVNNNKEATQDEVYTLISDLEAALSNLIVGVSPTIVELDKSAGVLEVGQSIILNAWVQPDASIDKTIIFESDNKQIATVTDVVYEQDTGITSVTVNAIGPGRAIISAIAVDGGASAQFSLSVNGVPEPNPEPNPDPTPSPSVPTVILTPTESVPAKTLETIVESIEGSTLIVKANQVKNGKLNISLSLDMLRKLMKSTTEQQVGIRVESPAEANQVTVQLPAQWLAELQLHKVEMISLEINGVIVIISADVLVGGLSVGASSKLQLSVEKTELSKLSQSVREAIGDQPVYDFRMSLDGKALEWQGTKVKVNLPFKLQSGQNTNHVIVYFINDNGQLEVVKSAKYDAVSNSISFQAKHFSKYAAAYVQRSFSDTGHLLWAVDAIEQLASKGIVQGVGGELFHPQNDLSRVEFVQMLIKATDLIDTEAVNQFSDVKVGAWYNEAVASAQQLNIVQGKSDGSFGINERITREDMAVMLHQVILHLDLELPEQQKKITPFTDQGQISSYAVEAVAFMQRRGLIVGMQDGYFEPKETTTRAQGAVIIARLLELMYPQ